MRRYVWVALLLLLVGCKGEQKAVQYNQLYQEAPMVVYIAPLNDLSPRHALRELDDSAYNASLNTAALQLYLTAADQLVSHGYYSLGPLASAQLAATEQRTGKQLRNAYIGDLHDSLGIDAVLFIDLIDWAQTHCSWTVEVEYTIRSTHTGGELLHSRVKATKIVPTDHRGNPKPLKADLDFQRKYGTDLETAQRCRLVEILNSYVLADIPSGQRARAASTEPYIPSHPEYYNLRIHRDGSVEMLKSTDN